MCILIENILYITSKINQPNYLVWMDSSRSNRIESNSKVLLLNNVSENAKPLDGFSWRFYCFYHRRGVCFDMLTAHRIRDFWESVWHIITINCLSFVRSKTFCESNQKHLQIFNNSSRRMCHRTVAAEAESKIAILDYTFCLTPSHSCDETHPPSYHFRIVFMMMCKRAFKWHDNN